MKVLKFGGSSVGNAENIEKVVGIVKNAIEKNSCAVVLSAMQGTTDDLIDAGKLAESGDEIFRQKINEIKAKHFEAIRTLFPASAQNDLLDSVKKRVGE
ncbi:MAG: bifunctional aspartate kinase/homoserine dehydrogenase I, partial [Acidobacteria bacterium]|nr:bifunctional aspartate kinase/homoserine dehydrogenase I [Acidobacteriota bacterium]